MRPEVALFWFRRDLRLEDNAGLWNALSNDLPVLPLFIFDSEILSQLNDKEDKRVSFIYTALQQIQEKLVTVKSSLDVRYGHPLTIFKSLEADYTIRAVYTNHDYEPYAAARDH